MLSPKKKKKTKKANTTPEKSALVQVGADKGASRFVRKDSPAGKQLAEARKAMKRKQAGKKLLRSEQKLIEKYFNPTKKGKNSPKKRTYKVKK